MKKQWFFAQFTDGGGRQPEKLNPEEDLKSFLNNNGLTVQDVKVMAWTDVEDGWQWYSIFYEAEQEFSTDSYTSSVKIKR